MKIKILLIVMLFSSALFAQQSEKYELTGGMGLAFEHTPAVVDYLNFNFAQSNQLSTAFNSSIEGWLEWNFRYNEKVKLGVEYYYNYFSYSNVNTIGFVYEFGKTIHALNVLAYYVITGRGYEFKLGGGLGPRYGLVKEKIYQTENYDATGFGLTLRGQALTALGGNFYANIGADARYDLIGVASNANKKLINDATGLEVNLSSLAFTVRIGVSYFF